MAEESKKIKTSLRSWLQTNFYKRKSFLDPTKNYSKLPKILVKKFANKKILNIGSGQEPLGEEIITLDKYENASIMGDALHLPIKSNSMDLVLSIAVLEHLKEPYHALREIRRVLKEKGEVYIEIPFIQPFHSSPDDYFRATLPGLKHWCRNFKQLKSGVCVGPGSAVTWLEVEYIRVLFGKIPILGLLIEMLFRLWSLPLKYIDKFIIDKKNAHISASAIYFHGKKI